MNDMQALDVVVAMADAYRHGLRSDETIACPEHQREAVEHVRSMLKMMRVGI